MKKGAVLKLVIKNEVGIKREVKKCQEKNIK